MFTRSLRWQSSSSSFCFWLWVQAFIGGVLTPDLLGSVKTNSGPLVQFVQLVWAGGKADNQTLLETKAVKAQVESGAR